MKITPVHRFLALLLASQPVFWMSNVALAQSFSPRSTGSSGVASVQIGEGQRVAAAFGQSPMPVQMGDLPASGPVAPVDVTEEVLERKAATSAPPVDEPIDPDKYMCGPGDVFELNFWGVQNFNVMVKVNLEGRAFVEKVGYFDLQGKTLSQARRMIRESVKRYYQGLSFEVTLAQPRTFLVQVVGEVGRPASYAARGVDRVAKLIAASGGLGPNASKRRIEIRRRGGQVLGADLLRYAMTGDVKYNPYVLDGDVIRVPFEELSVTINGAVNRPGRYELVDGKDVLELVELAGGLAPSATTRLPFTIVRRMLDDEKPDLMPIAFGKDATIPSIALQHEDSVRMPSVMELQESVTVIGAVAGAVAADEASTLRRLPFVHGDSVRTLLERLGGVGPLADLRGAYILRNGKPYPVDLEALLVRRNLEADRPVELGDSVMIPFKRRTIVVEGAVFTPGQYPFNPTFGVEEYLALAGGPNRFAQSMSNVRVISPSGQTKRYSRDLEIEPGSSLVVPERNFSRSEIVQIALSAAGILLSGVAVFAATR